MNDEAEQEGPARGSGYGFRKSDKKWRDGLRKRDETTKFVAVLKMKARPNGRIDFFDTPCSVFP